MLFFLTIFQLYQVIFINMLVFFNNISVISSDLYQYVVFLTIFQLYQVIFINMLFCLTIFQLYQVIFINMLFF